MVRFSGAALSSLALLGTTAAATTTAARRGAGAVDYRRPPVGEHTIDISPTSSILLNQIRDSLLADDGTKLRGEGRDRRLLERSLTTALSHPNSALDDALVNHLPPSHPARHLLSEHNAKVEEFESTRHLSRFETTLRRTLGLYPFGDLDAESALDEGRAGYGPLGHLGLAGNGNFREGEGKRRLDDPPPLPPPNQPGVGQPGQPGDAPPPPPPPQPGAIPEPGLQQQQPPPGQPEPGQPQQPGQPGGVPEPGAIPEPGLQPQSPPPPPGQPEPGAIPEPGLQPPPPEPGTPPEPQPGAPEGQPGGVPGQPGVDTPPPPPPPPDVVPPAPPQAGGQPGLEAPVVVPPGGLEPGDGSPPAVVPPPPQPGAPGAPEEPAGGVPGQPGAPGAPVVGAPEPVIMNMTQQQQKVPQGSPCALDQSGPESGCYYAGGGGPDAAKLFPCVSCETGFCGIDAEESGVCVPPVGWTPGSPAPLPSVAEGGGGGGVPGAEGGPPPPQPGAEGGAPPAQPGATPGAPPDAAAATPPILNQTQMLMPGGDGDPDAPPATPPTEGGADPALYTGPGPVILNQTETPEAGGAPELGAEAPPGSEQPQPGEPGTPEAIAAAAAAAAVAATTEAPSAVPSSVPTSPPSAGPTAGPTSGPSAGPTGAPTNGPTDPKAVVAAPEPEQPGSGAPNQPNDDPGQQPPNENEPTLPSDTPQDIVVPKNGPPDSALPPGFDSGEVLPGGLLNTYQTVPLLQGYGTHYASVWVGSPSPQRVSVIVDTGSHFTAFPCEGCAGCGEEHHTDLYFHPETSTTFTPLGCGECSDGARCSNGKCTFGQSYTEGSSWKAYQARDQFFCGGASPSSAADPVDLSYAIEFMFGCQTSETGLFVGQLADGIMGMAAHRATLVKNMYEQKKLQHLMFAMCFRRELEASKLGVTAGVLTLGGVDARLERTPMVYARNTVKDGWFTVYVKGMYLRPGGGQSAGKGGGLAGPFGDAHAEHGDPTLDGSSNDAIKPPVKIDMNPSTVNSGKGVIVDSGTTDTYFHRALGVTFNRQWKALTGKDHSNKAMKLTRDQLLGLPTLLVQLEAYNDAGGGAGAAPGGANGSPAPGSPGADAEMIPGTAAPVDPSSPHDVLLAVPASHYMEYSPKDETYTSRLYFTESAGGVLGANAMMGHDVLFDWENGRVGFSESNCDYRDVVSVNSAAPEDEGGNAGGNDCRLSVPTLSVGCTDTIDLAPCEEGDGNTVLHGTEKWSTVVESPGTPAGKSCEEVLLTRDVIPGESPPTVSCDGNGLCSSVRQCEMTCSNAQTVGVGGGGIGGGEGGTANQPLVPLDDDDLLGFESGSGAEDQRCGNNLWGACEYSCNQTRIKSILMSDGECHETSVEKRPCHVDACGRSDPCRVPFVVHAILGFRGANAPLFTGKYRERFVEAFASTVNMNRVGKDELFSAGDVKVLAANHWYESEDESGTPVGMKLIVEISIFNSEAHLPTVAYEPLQEESPEDVEGIVDVNTTDSEGSRDNPGGDSPTDVKQKAKQTLSAMITAVRTAWNNLGGPPKSTCDESDIYPLSKTALHVHMEFERATFMKELIIVLMEYGDTPMGGGGGGGGLGGGGSSKGEGSSSSSSWSDPFSPMYKTRSYQDASSFLSSWTIKTEIGGGTFHDHSLEYPTRGFNSEYIQYLVDTNGQVLIAALGALLGVCCFGWCCGRNCARRGYERHATVLMEKLAAINDEKERGKYQQVGGGANGGLGLPDHDSDDDENEAGFAGVNYRDRHAGDEEGANANGLANGDESGSEESDDESDDDDSDDDSESK